MFVKRRSASEHRDAASLVTDQLYPVYAVLFDSSIQYLVSEERSFSFPFYVSSQAVDLVDTQLPSFMHFSPALLSTMECSSRAPMVGFFEIVTDRFFYQRLVEGAEEATRVWYGVRDQKNRGQKKNRGQSTFSDISGC